MKRKAAAALDASSPPTARRSTLPLQLRSGKTLNVAGFKDSATAAGGVSARSLGQGHENEDELEAAKLANSSALFLFDGHGGGQVSAALRSRMPTLLAGAMPAAENEQAPPPEAIEEVLTRTFALMDLELHDTMLKNYGLAKSDVVVNPAQRVGRKRSPACDCRQYREVPCRCMTPVAGAPPGGPANVGSTGTVVVVTDEHIVTANWWVPAPHARAAPPSPSALPSLLQSLPAPPCRSPSVRHHQRRLCGRANSAGRQRRGDPDHGPQTIVAKRRPEADRGHRKGRDYWAREQSERDLGPGGEEGPLEHRHHDARVVTRQPQRLRCLPRRLLALHDSRIRSKHGVLSRTAIRLSHKAHTFEPASLPHRLTTNTRPCRILG